MFFAYIDESGASVFDPTQHFFVLAAIVINVDQCIGMQEQLQKLKAEFSLQNVEIKGREIENSKNIFRRFSAPAKRELVQRLLELLFACDAHLFSIVFASEFFAAIQLADLCAYNIFRALQIKFGQPFLAAKAPGQAEYMQPINHQAFEDPIFINELFLQPDVDLPALARLLERRGRIIKLP